MHRQAPANRRNLSQAVSEEILDWIRSGELKPGDRVPTERELMERFAVGRNTVREAIQSLVALGIVDVRPGRGTLVRAIADHQALDSVIVGRLLGGQTILDLYEFRLLLEVETASAAAERATAADIAQMRAAHERYRATLSAGHHDAEADIAFHLTIARAAHNAIYQRVFNAIGDLVLGARRPIENAPEAKDARHSAAKEHELICASIEGHDRDAARRAMEAHLTKAIELVREIYQIRARSQAATGTAPTSA